MCLPPTTECHPGLNGEMICRTQIKPGQATHSVTQLTTHSRDLRFIQISQPVSACSELLLLSSYILGLNGLPGMFSKEICCVFFLLLFVDWGGDEEVCCEV